MSPPHPPVISVMLAVPDAARAVAWYERALGAQQLWNLGSVVGLEVQGAAFFVGEPENNGWESPEKLGMPSVRIEVFCDDPDAVITRALAAGASAGGHRVVVHDMPWGPHRQGGFVDPFGHVWFVGDRSPLRKHGLPQPEVNRPPGEPMTRLLPTALHHTAFLVRDLEGAAQRMADALGIGPWNIWTIVPAECKMHGHNSPFSFRVALATIGGGTYELITPLSGRSILHEHLERHGEGFHHSCLVYPTLAAAHQAKAELQKQGREAVQEASAGDAFDFTYFLFPEIGSLVEILYLDATQMPAPDVVIQPSR